MKKLSPDNLKCPVWHDGLDADKARETRIPPFEIALPLVVIVLLAMLKAWTMAVVVAVAAVGLVLLRIFSPPARREVDLILGRFAEALGRLVAFVLLAPPFFVIMTLIGRFNRLTGIDPLHLRNKDATTYWLPSDVERRRSRYIGNMFCSEQITQSRISVLPLFLMGFLLVGATELGLRCYGMGNPILYVQDPDIGYYPKPSQEARYPGRVISINSHGMRAPELSSVRAPGSVRILMIGDSTLAGTKVSNEYLYSTLLEQKLNHLAGKRTFEVLNLGVNAWGPLHERAYIRKFGTCDADVVIICGPVANTFRPLYGLERLPFSPSNHPPRLALEHVAYELMWRIREETLGPPSWGIPGESQTEQARRGIDAYVDMAGYLKERHTEVLMEMLPMRTVTMGARENPAEALLFGSIRKRMSDVGVTANCAGAIFKGIKPSAQIYYDGVHFDYVGHRLYADYLAGRVSEHSERVKSALQKP